MAQSPPSNHDSRGRFTSGNKVGQGNPHHRRVAALRTRMLDCVSPQDFGEIITALVTRAKEGDIAAIKLLLDRLLGRAPDHDAAAADARAELEAIKSDEDRLVAREFLVLSQAVGVAQRRDSLNLSAEFAGLDPALLFPDAPE